MSLWDVGVELERRLTGIFRRGADGRRPVFGATEKFQTDPHWRDLVPFHEYFNGDTGSGVGASHQTGWTALVAKLLQQLGEPGEAPKGSRVEPGERQPRAGRASTLPRRPAGEDCALERPGDPERVLATRRRVT
jgi:hypothetical protein